MHDKYVDIFEILHPFNSYEYLLYFIHFICRNLNQDDTWGVINVDFTSPHEYFVFFFCFVFCFLMLKITTIVMEINNKTTYLKYLWGK